MGRKTEKNYIKRYFLRLFLLVSVLVSVMGIALMQFSKRVVGDEIIKLHQTILRSTAGEVSAVLGDLQESLLEIGENVQVMEWLENGGGKNEIDGLVEDEIYLNFKRGNPLRVYIYDRDSLRYCSDQPEISWDMVRERLEDGEEKDFWMTGPVRMEEEGLYRNSFFMMQRVRNLLNGDTVGYVCFQFSEKSLYDAYSRLREAEREYYIVDPAGVLVSGTRKMRSDSRMGWGQASPGWTGPDTARKRADRPERSAFMSRSWGRTGTCWKKRTCGGSGSL